MYPENTYGYTINLLIDEIANQSDSVIINRASYNEDLTNVREAIKELGKYELRKYELNRQKQILATKKGTVSKFCEKCLKNICKYGEKNILNKCSFCKKEDSKILIKTFNKVCK